MDRDAMDLTVTQQRIPDGTRRLLQLQNVGDPKSPSISAFFDMIGEHNVDPPPLLDGFVFGILLYAMRLGQNIHVHGALSLQMLRNVNELQEAWAAWRPELYRKVHIACDEVVASPREPRPTEIFAAFSGGVDSTFTVLRHAGKVHKDELYPLRKSVLMVHGFDVPLERPEQLEALIQRSAPLMNELGLTVRVLRTNLKTLELQRWEDSFMAQLTACVCNYSHEFSHTLVASAKSYNDIHFPEGSTAATDHLLSGATMQIVHDGACATRTGKVALIAGNTAATACVKVCWEGSNAHENCGVCEKCLRTRLNFRAVGVDAPACFAGAPGADALIENVHLRRDTLCEELASIIRYARAHNVNDAWVDALQRRVDRYAAEKREDNYGRVRTAFVLVRRGEWKRLAGKTVDVLRSSVRLPERRENTAPSVRTG